MERDEFFLKRIRELANISYHRDICTFSDFLNLYEQNLLESIKYSVPGVKIEKFGGYDNAERQIAVFRPVSMDYSWNFPIDCLRAEPKSVKFSEPLSHRDYLGAILNLGVDRSVVGDIIINDSCAYIFCIHKMTDFFLENLERVRHTSISINKVDSQEKMPSPEMELMTGTCASVRLDSLIALAFRASRNSIVPLIESGMVFVNGKLITSNGYEPKDGDIISVRKKGRFRFDGVSHQTKKGRCSVRLMRYIG